MEWEEKISAIKSRDKSYDGRFYVAVKSTKIVCCPSCPSRIPLDKNIVCVDTLEEALENGYRPCKRCKPDIIEISGRE